MKFDDIPAQHESVQIVVRNNKVWESLNKKEDIAVLSIEPSRVDQNRYDLYLSDGVLNIGIENSVEQKKLNAILSSGPTRLLVVRNVCSDLMHAELCIVTFSNKVIDFESFEIGYNESVSDFIEKNEYIEKNKYRGGNIFIPKYLYEHFCYKSNGVQYFFIMAGPATEIVKKQIDQEIAEKAKKNEKSDGVEPESEPKPEPATEIDGKSFCLYGDYFRFVATESSLCPGKYVTSKYAPIRNKNDKAIRIAKGTINFIEYSKSGELGLFAAAQLKKISEESNAYLKKWEEYGNTEGEFLLKEARRFGIISYNNKVANKNGTVTVKIVDASEDALDLLYDGGVDALCIAEEVPQYLTDEKMSFEQFAGFIIDEEDESLGKKGKKEEKIKEKSVAVKSYNYETRSITFDEEDLPYDSGNMYLSIVGEIAQIKRRIRANKLIKEGRAANPQLGLLIEENGVVNFSTGTKSIPPLSNFTYEKLFSKNPPTQKQEEAIRIALNTPDIALIQGPPGTGKTTVIAAILERLNEEYVSRNNSGNGKGAVLLSGFQHDAVENMIDRISLNGLPVPKFGRKSGEDGHSLFMQKMGEWCDDVASKIREKNPHLEEAETEKRVKELCSQYINAPTPGIESKLLNEILMLGPQVLGNSLYQRIKNQEQQSKSSTNRDPELLAIIRGLRIKEGSFADDGADRALDLLDKIENVLEEDEKKLLMNAAGWRDGNSLDFLPQLRNLKEKLLMANTMPPVFSVDKPNDAVIDIVTETIEAIRHKGLSTRDAKTLALAEFLNELECNPSEMINSIADYSFAFAATCQQSANIEMQNQKGIIHGSPNQQQLEYEYVIVDEAARVSPRDLLVSMVQGKKIILVGDHRQLPHIINEEVARAIERDENADLDENSWIQKSMFEYLFSERLKQLEMADPSHPRRVTLDKQYRMHPLLGDFISRNFYERHDASEKFGSGLPAEFFKNELDGIDGKPAVWLNVPNEMGMFSREGTSLIRKAEANAISDMLDKWISSEKGKDLTYGVISFYRAQADLIRKNLKKYADNKNVRVGTVDSFQGMEFDVVFLSMVRTFELNSINACVAPQKIAQRMFGHLCLYNRLNVSMSRQKRVLVVVGDSKILHNEYAEEYVPGLVDFYNLCQKEGVVLDAQ